MSDPISIEGIDVSIGDGPGDMSKALPEKGDSLGICILGNFSGNLSEKKNSSGFKLHRVNRDNFDSLPEKINSSLSLNIKNETGPDQIISLHIEEMEHFHPDYIFDTLPEFQALRRLRKELSNPDTFKSALREIQSWNPRLHEQGDKVDAGKKKQDTTAAPLPEGGSVLDQILTDDNATMDTALSQTSGTDVDRFVAAVVQPYLLPKEDPRQEEYQEAVDSACSSLMNSILHHPDFQALESAWRGLGLLIRRLETDDDLQIYILDASKNELLADLLRHDDPALSKIHTLLSRKAEIDTIHWGIISGLYPFGSAPEDVAMLQLMGYVAQSLRVSFVGQASSAILGCDNLAATPDYADWQHEKNKEAALIWQELRRFPFAGNIGLAFPRFLLRNPYGEATNEIDRFFYEETEDVGHENFLWGNSSLLCALLIGKAFNQSGWDFKPGTIQEVENLPSPVLKEGEETRLLPCAEVVFTHQTAEVILDAGLMPMLSMKESDFVRLARFQSVAYPLSGLAGPW